MNDIEEVRFGIIEGSSCFKLHPDLRDALGSEDRHSKYVGAFERYINEFERNHLLDTYVFCLSEHRPDDNDGLLSMWRGYGGNGRGAAIVFDTSKLTPIEGTPLILARVEYATHEQRLAWFDATAKRFAPLVAEAKLPDESVHIAAGALFERLKLFSLFTKHKGFEEEQEWRVVYVSERDEDKNLGSMLHYSNGPRGVEPKLRLKIEPLAGILGNDVRLDNLIDRILLGPSVASPLAVRSVQRMLEVIQKPELSKRVQASSIPFRPT